MSVVLISVSHDTVVSIKHEEQTRHYYVNFQQKELRFERLKSDAGIFLYWKKSTNIVVAVIYVDDALFCGPTKAIVDEIKGLFMKKWECRDLGPATSFLNMRIKCNGRKILIDQYSYLEKVLERFGMQNARTAPHLCLRVITLLNTLARLILNCDSTSNK